MSEVAVHLHVHSEYSLLDGQANVGRLVERAAKLDQPAIGLTDHGVMNGAVELYKAARKQGVKPLVGCELYLADDHAAREPGRRRLNHLTVLARDAAGYRNLMALSSLGFTEGLHQGKPAVDLAQISAHGEGLIVLTGCLASRFCARLADGDEHGAREHVDELFGAVGRENVYFELQRNGIELQDRVNDGIARIAADTGRPLAGTADVHYLRKEDYEAHECLLCIQTGKQLSDPKRLSFETNEFYVKSSQEMAADFQAWPEALRTTLEIAERCDVEIPLGQQLLPRYLPDGEDEAAYLRERVWEGLRRRYGDPVPAEAAERAEMELGVVGRMGYDAYFLIVWDFIAWAKDRGIPVGPGRGSAAGSIIAYALQITDLDPIEHDLLFERFLNPDRVSMPDIDIDFSVRGREEVMRYVTGKYGRDSVAQIATFGRMLPRAATKDAARVMGFDYQTGDRLAKLIPDAIMGKTPPLGTCLAEGTELRKAYDSDATAKQVLDTAQRLEGTVRNLGIHAAAVVIADRPLTDLVPVQLADARTVDEHGEKVFRRITQYPMGPIEDIGLLKMDFLGLRNLDVIEDCLAVIETSGRTPPDMSQIPLDDPATYAMLGRGDSIGVFQFESEGMQRTLRQVAPTEFDDIIALVALYRPGAMDQIPTYAAAKRDPSLVPERDPRLDPILAPTKGVILYQEQSMRISRDLAGFSPGRADDLRKAIGKKKLDQMASLEPEFRAGCEASGTDPALTDWLWATNVASANYSFNKSHAACYGLVTYRTAWLKANFPSEYMAALLSSVMSTKDKVPFFLGACEDMGIEVLPPDVNASDHDFTVHEGGAIRFGLDAVKGVGHSAVEAIKAAREQDGPFTSIWDFCERIDARLANRKLLDALVRCGALASTGDTRRGMLAVLEQAQGAGQKAQADAVAGQGSIFDLLGDGDDAGAAAPAGGLAHPPVPGGEFEQRELLAMEKETVGLFLSDHPLRAIRDALQVRCDVSLADVGQRRPDDRVTVGGMVTEVRRMTSRKGDPMMRGVLEDTEGSCPFIVFPRKVDGLAPVLEPDAVVLAQARISARDDGHELVLEKAEAFAPKAAEVAAAAEEARAQRERREQAALPTVVRMRLDARELGEDALVDLRHVLEDHGGDCEVVLTLLTSAGPRTLRLGERFRVADGPGLRADLLRSLPTIVLADPAPSGDAAPAPDPDSGAEPAATGDGSARAAGDGPPGAAPEGAVVAGDDRPARGDAAGGIDDAGPATEDPGAHGPPPGWDEAYGSSSLAA